MKLYIHFQTSMAKSLKSGLDISNLNPYFAPCACDYLSKLELRLIHVSKDGPMWDMLQIFAAKLVVVNECSKQNADGI